MRLMSQCPKCRTDINVPLSFSGLFQCPRCNASLQSNLPPLLAGAIVVWVVLASSFTALLGQLGAVLAVILGFVLGVVVAAFRSLRPVADSQP